MVSRWKTGLMTGLVVAIALLAPVVLGTAMDRFAPGTWSDAMLGTPGDDEQTFDDGAIRFKAGADYEEARRAGVADGLLITEGEAGHMVSLRGLSGTTLQIDRLVLVEKDPDLVSFRLSITKPLSGSLEQPPLAVLRLWHGDEPPTADDDPQVCLVLDLTAPEPVGSQGECHADEVHVQAAYRPPDEGSGASAIRFRPTGLNMA